MNLQMTLVDCKYYWNISTMVGALGEDAGTGTEWLQIHRHTLVGIKKYMLDDRIENSEGF